MSDYDDGYMDGRASLDDRIERLESRIAELVHRVDAALEDKTK